MKKYEIMVGTVTQAMKARDILRKNGFKAYLERKSQNIGKYGCGYSVVIKENLDRATQLLEDNKVKIIEIISTAAR